jgi:hypothetical protein
VVVARASAAAWARPDRVADLDVDGGVAGRSFSMIIVRVRCGAVTAASVGLPIDGVEQRDGVIVLSAPVRAVSPVPAAVEPGFTAAIDAASVAARSPGRKCSLTCRYASSAALIVPAGAHRNPSSYPNVHRDRLSRPGPGREHPFRRAEGSAMAWRLIVCCDGKWNTSNQAVDGRPGAWVRTRPPSGRLPTLA